MRRGAAVLVLAGCAAGGLALGQAQPWRADEKPRTRTPNCTTAGCHSKEVTHKFVHGPAAVSACDMCHTYKDVAAHSFTLKAEGKDLCTFCHANHAHAAAKVPHEPYVKGDCLSCHNPHGGETRQLLAKPDTNTLCLSCHEGVLAGGEHRHGPLHEGRCTDCHTAHGGEHARLLLKPGRAMCLSCHEEVGDHLSGAAHAHKPLEGDCLQCHTAHTSAFAMQLKQGPKDLCISCHEEVGKHAMGASNPHSAVLEGQACLNCHQPHASSHAHLTKDDSVGACLACHRDPDAPKAASAAEPPRPVFRSDLAKLRPAEPETRARPASPVREFKGGLAGLHMHAPVAEGECSACHDVHGGERAVLLKGAYSAEFYQPFSEKAFELCFQCHDPKLVTTREAAGETNFRDGARNLHYLHVNQEQGRSCRVCHTVHGSTHGSQIRETAAFGNWELPITFVKTESGGSCAVGCHKEYSYDRMSPRGRQDAPPAAATPAPEPASAPPTVKAPPPKPAEPRDPGQVPEPVFRKRK